MVEAADGAGLQCLRNIRPGHDRKRHSPRLVKVGIQGCLGNAKVDLSGVSNGLDRFIGCPAVRTVASDVNGHDAALQSAFGKWFPELRSVAELVELVKSIHNVRHVDDANGVSNILSGGGQRTQHAVHSTKLKLIDNVLFATHLGQRAEINMETAIGVFPDAVTQAIAKANTDRQGEAGCQ